MSYDNSKQVVIRKVFAMNPTSTTPLMSVEFNGPDGVKYAASMWEWTRKDGTPVLDSHGNKMYKGNYVVDTYTQDQGDKGIAQAKKAVEPDPPGGGFQDSDVPFSNHELRTFA